MERILIIGCCGAGKSTFSQKLAEKTKLPLVHLDKEFFLPNWVVPDDVEWKAKIENLLSGEKWIMDGNYLGTLDMRLKRADTVFFLNYSRLLCFFRVLKRSLTSWHTVRIDMAADCPERIDREFLKYVWNFHKRKNPKIEVALENNKHVKLYRFKNDKETAKFLGERFR